MLRIASLVLKAGRTRTTVPFMGIELLEARTLLSTFTWSGGSGTGGWNDPNNWNPIGLPGAADDVVLTGAGGNSALVQDGDSFTVHSVTATNQRLQVWGGQLTITGNLTTNDEVELGRGPGFSNASLAVQGTAFINGGQLKFQDHGRYQGTTIITNGNLKTRPGDSAFTAPTTVTMHGLGFLDGQLPFNLTLRAEGTSGTPNVIYWTGEALIDPGASLVLDSTAAAGVRIIAAATPIINVGTITVNPGAGGERTIVGSLYNGGAAPLPFVGAVNINANTSLYGGGSSYSNEGTITIATGKILSLTGANQVFDNAGTLNGGGTLSVQGSNNTFTYTSGSITLAQTIVVSGRLNIQPGGTAAGLFSLRGASTFAGNIGVGQVVQVLGTTGLAGDVTWVGGFTNAGTLALTSVAATRASLSVGGSTMVNSGSLVFGLGAGGMRKFVGDLTNTGSVFVNQPTWFASTDGVLTNSGTITGTAQMTLSGRLEWTAGTITGAGKTTILATGSLGVSGAADKLLQRRLDNFAVADWTGGNIRFLGATLNNLAGAVFNASGAGSLLSDGGTNLFSNAGALNKLSTSTVVVSSAGGGVGFGNSGTLNVQAGVLTVQVVPAQVSGNTLLGGTWLVQTSSTLNIPASIRTNNAVVRLSGAASFFGAMNTMSMNNGTFAMDQGRALTITPNGGTLINNGTIALGVGTLLVISGAYAQSGMGTLAFDIAGTANATFGRFSVTGTAALDGTLVTNLVSNFVPVSGNTFNIVAAATRTGTFRAPLVPLPLTLVYSGTLAQLTVP